MDQLTSKQISEWEVYDRIDPIGTWRDDFRTAKLESLLVNIVQQLYAKKGTKPVITTPIDFMPDWLGVEKQVTPKKQSVEEMKRILTSFAKVQNRKVNVRTKPPVKKTNRRKE